ncbi:MAG: D-hexose-6-phosphate mutarotase [Candidatus Acidiferrum sp.]
MTQTLPTLEELHRRFAIPGLVQVVADPTGNPKVLITSTKSTGEILLHGAQVTSWKPTGASEVIFVSRQAVYAEGKAIRGGIPICFPWFRAKAGDPQAPAHGFVRTRLWSLESVEQAGGNVFVTMSTQSDDTTKKWWPHDFRAQLRATFGSELKLELTVTNTSAAPFRFEEALHTYHTVGDIHKARIRGLDGVSYLDNTQSNAQKTQSGDAVITSHTDSAYITQNAFELLDPTLHRSVRVSKQNSAVTVVWNPWEQAAHAMSDFADDEWRQMLCVEAANIMQNAVDLAPAQSHTLTVTMAVNPL